MDNEGNIRNKYLFDDVLIVGILIEDDRKLCFSEGNVLKIYSLEENPIEPINIQNVGACNDISAILETKGKNLILGLSYGFC